MKSLTPVQLRHKLHQNPEIAYQEFQTTELILKNIRANSSNNKLKIHTPFPTGILAEYTVNDSPYLLFRADIDALPINEENEIEFKSHNNNMHACGHDVHTSILYGFLQRVLRKKPDRNLLFLFQPAEESGGGAIKFYDTGIFKKFNIKNAFALHVTDEYKVNTIASTPGVLFASALELDVAFTGVSAHVAFPHDGRNAFNALRDFLDDTDKILSELDYPIVFAPGKINAGNVRNIIPGYAKFESTIRALSMEKVNQFVQKIELVLKKIKRNTHVDNQISRGAQYPEVIVDAKLFNKISKILSAEFDFIDCGYKMTGEDFGFFSQRFPSFMFWLGTSRSKKSGLHNPKFLPDDSVIDSGIKAFEMILNSL